MFFSLNQKILIFIGIISTIGSSQLFGISEDWPIQHCKMVLNSPTKDSKPYQENVKNLLINYANSKHFDGCSFIINSLREKQIPGCLLWVLQETLNHLIINKNSNSVIKIINELSPSEKTSVAETVVTAYVQKNDFINAQKLINLISNEFVKSQLIEIVILGLAKTDEWTQAITKLDEIKYLDHSNRTRKKMALCAAQKGDLNLAIKIATPLTNTVDFEEVLDEIIELALSQERYIDAIKLSLLSKRSEAKLNQAAKQAILIAEEPQLRQAIANANTINNPELKIDTLWWIAARMIKKNKSDQAIALLKSIEGTTKILPSIACILPLIEEGNLEPINLLLNKIDPITREGVQLKVANELGKLGQSHFALLLIQQWEPSELRYRALSDYLISWSKTKPNPSKIAMILNQILEPGLFNRTAKSLIEYWVENQQFNEGFATLKEIKNPKFKWNQLITFTTLISQNNQSIYNLRIDIQNEMEQLIYQSEGFEKIMRNLEWGKHYLSENNLEQAKLYINNSKENFKQLSTEEKTIYLSQLPPEIKP